MFEGVVLWLLQIASWGFILLVCPLLIFVVAPNLHRWTRRQYKLPPAIEVGGAEENSVVRRRFTAERLAQLTRRGGPEVIVIGAGIGGLTTAAMLARDGYRVLVLEQHDRIGGATHTFDIEHVATGLPDAFLESDPLLADAVSTIPEISSRTHVKCEFDSGYHYTTQAFANPVSRPGAFLRFAAGTDLKFNDLGDPYDRVMFPASARDATQLGIGEYQFVRGGPRRLASQLSSQLAAFGAHDDEMMKVIEDRMTTFFELTRSAVVVAVRIFIARLFALPLQRVFGALQRRIDAWAVRGVARAGEITTAYAIKAIIGCGYSKRDVLARRPLPEGVEPRIDGCVSALPVPDELRERLMADERAMANFHRLLRRAMALLVHPVGDYAAQPAESSFLAHSFVVDYYRRGSSYPARTAQDISAAMARTVLRHGGDCLVGAHVARILRDGTGDRRAVGVRVYKSSAPDCDPTDIFASRVVVNAAGIHHLYRPGGLLDNAQLTARVQRETKFVPSMSHFYVFVALKGSPAELKLPGTNMWCINGIGTDAGDVDGAFKQYFDEGLSGVARRSAVPPAVYITFPCAKNAEEWNKHSKGVSNAIIFCDAKFEWFAHGADLGEVEGDAETPTAMVDRENRPPRKGSERSSDYKRRKKILRDALLEVLFAKRPDLRGAVLWVEAGTPLTSQFYLGAVRGGDYGTRVDTNYFSPSALQFLMRPDTPVPGLWQSGQDAMTPSISGAMHGGVLAACRIAGAAATIRMFATIAGEQYAAARRRDRRLTASQAAKEVLRAWLRVEI